MKHVLILAPLALEQKAIAQHLQTRGFAAREERVGPLNTLYYPDLGWRLAQGGHGKTQFAIQTQFFLDAYPDVATVICAGCAGALAPDIAIGDIVVAEQTLEHDFRLKFITRPLPSFSADPALLQIFQKHKGARVHFGTVASGDEDIVETTRAMELQKQTGALAVAWEGAGGARACRFNQIPFLEIRGITDTADHQAVAHFQTHLHSAMAHVTDFLLSCVSSKNLLS